MGANLCINEIVRIPGVRKAVWFNNQIVAACINRQNSALNYQIVVGNETYPIPNACSFLAASEHSVYAAGRDRRGNGFTFVYPQRRLYPTVGGMGVYEKNGNVWYRSPDNNDTLLFPAPLVRLEKNSKGIIMAASNYGFAVIHEQVEVRWLSVPLLAAGLTENNGPFYVPFIAGKRVFVYWNDNCAPFPRVLHIRVVEDTIVGGDARGLWVSRDGDIQKVDLPIFSLSAGRGRSVLACVGDMVLEIVP